MEEKVTTAEKAKEEKAPKEVKFLDLLKEGKIKEGDKIGFLPNGQETETVIVVDKSFLDLELQPSEFYEKFKYNLK